MVEELVAGPRFISSRAFVHGTGLKIPFPYEYAWDNVSVIPYSECMLAVKLPLLKYHTLPPDPVLSLLPFIPPVSDDGGIFPDPSELCGKNQAMQTLRLVTSFFAYCLQLF